jgi:hypothetical protein
MVLLIVLGPTAVRTFGKPLGVLMGRSPNLVVLTYCGQLSMLLLIVLVSCGDSNVKGTQGCVYGEVTKTRRFNLFWPEFYATTHNFAVPG